jgi:ferritin-like protein
VGDLARRFAEPDEWFGHYNYFFVSLMVSGREAASLAPLLRAVLDAERTSMRTHRSIYERTKERDPLTADLALSLLTDSVGGEQEMERPSG